MLKIFRNFRNFSKLRSGLFFNYFDKSQKSYKSYINFSLNKNHYCTDAKNNSNIKIKNIDSDEDEDINYDFFDSHLILNNKENAYADLNDNSDLKQVLKNMKCQGCGVDLQIEDKNKIGFIPQKKFLDYLNKTEIKNEGNSQNNKNKTETTEEVNVDNDNEDSKIKEFEHIHDKATLKKLMKLKNKHSVLTCERCFKLKNYLNFDEVKSKPKEENKLDNYTFLLKKINQQRLIHQIMTRISSRAHDVTELEATINKSVLKEIRNKKIGLTFIVNKYDVLPLKVVEERINIWVGETLKEITKDIEGIAYNYIIVSSKTGHNFDYVIHRIKKIKEKAKEEKIPRPKIFVLGYANAGKSSFINKLIHRSNRYIKDENIHKIEYKKNYNINENSLFEENKDESNLTSSPLPGTTIGITKVESMKMGVKLFDTPGIPNRNSMTFFMNDYLDMISTTINRKIIPFTCSVKQGYSIWLGAIARIDFMSGEDKYLSFFFSHNITIHRTPMLNAEDLFAKHSGKLLRPAITNDIQELKLKSHSFNLKCEIFSILNFDIAISGLGWFSISGKGLAQFEVLVPEGVEVFLRKKPLMPFEIKARGVKKFFGKTINSTSKINRKFSRPSNNNNKSQDKK